MSEDPPTIVAEISVNWPRANRVLAQKFEEVIEVNRQRGYALQSWRFSQIKIGKGMTETIIAVFIRT